MAFFHADGTVNLFTGPLICVLTNISAYTDGTQAPRPTSPGFIDGPDVGSKSYPTTRRATADFFAIAPKCSRFPWAVLRRLLSLLRRALRVRLNGTVHHLLVFLHEGSPNSCAKCHFRRACSSRAWSVATNNLLSFSEQQSYRLHP